VVEDAKGWGLVLLKSNNDDRGKTSNKSIGDFLDILLFRISNTSD
jgi:hypothetical protein